jgi:hypothetical protein
MSCTRVVPELIVGGGQGLIRSKKTKGHPKGWPDCLLCLAPRTGFESTTCELTVVFLSHHRGGNQLNQLNQLHNYTAPDVNMLHIAESGAENNKGMQYLPPGYPNAKHVNDNISAF